MKIVRNHIIEHSQGLLYCGEYFTADEKIVEADNHRNLCGKCSHKYGILRTDGIKTLSIMNRAHTLYFNSGEPYIIETKSKERTRITHVCLSFLEREGFIYGWFDGNFTGNVTVYCRITSKGRILLNQNRG